MVKREVKLSLVSIYYITSKYIYGTLLTGLIVYLLLSTLKIFLR